MSGYTEDLAYIHDAGFGELARAAVPVIIAALRARGIYHGLIADLGCGSGIAARELIQAGYNVLCVDISPSMIRLARKNAPGARFVTASMLAVKLPPCDAVISLGECVNYLFDTRNNRSRLTRFFSRVHEALRPGGIFVFDFCEPGQIPGSGRRQEYALGADWAVLVDATEDRKHRTLERRIISFRATGKLYRRTDEAHRLQLYPASELLAELRRIGFRARLVRRYGVLALRAGCAAIVASKAQSPQS